MTKQQSPWDRPQPFPDSDVPEGSPDELYYAIGKALSEWSSVEHRLCMLFVGLYMDKHGYGAYKLYGALPSTAARMAALRVSADALFSKKSDHAAYAKSILSLTEKFLGRRNDIAHGLVAHREQERKATLIEPHYNIKHASRDLGHGGYEYGAQHILDCAERFHDLNRELEHAQSLLFAPVRRGLGVRPPASTTLTIYVEPFRTALARRLSGRRNVLDPKK